MILLRPATLADADLLRSWRNDETMRKNSFHSSVVGKKEHLRWLRGSLKGKARRIYIAECPGVVTGQGQIIPPPPFAYDWVPIGEGRLDFAGESVMFDIEVAPEHRGKGYGLQILSALVAKAREWKPGVPLVAHVKAFNTPSLRTFLGAGFSMRGNRCLTLEMR